MGKAILFAAAVLLAALGGCTGAPCNCSMNGCNNTCSATTKGYAAFYAPPDAGGVVSFTADSPCTATFETYERMTVSRLGAGTCTARISYGDGVTFVFHIEYTPVQGGCGCYLSPNSTLESPDAGPG
jgi:hypothetical protein